MPQSPASTSTRALRENLREILEQAARGKEVLVTHRGKPYVRIVPITSDEGAANRYPLRGSVTFVADDLDAAPAKRAPSARRKAK